jgi:hypothetical protein
MRIGIGAVVALSGLALASAVTAREPAQPAGEVPAAAHHLDGCPASLGAFDGSDATIKLVETCLGRPTQTAPNPDGRVIYTYLARDGSLYLDFLFDKTGALVRFRAYAPSAPKK